MLLRDPAERPPYRTRESEMFEAAFFRLEQNFPYLVEAYDALTWTMERDPRGNSELCRAFRSEGRELRVSLTPRTTRYPSLRVLVEVQEEIRRVYFWHLSAMLSTSRF